MAGIEIILLCLVSFFSASLAAIVGGAGLLNLPAMQSFDIESVHALATNKLIVTFSNLTSCLTLMKKKVFSPKKYFYLVPICIFGSMMGASITASLPIDKLNHVIPVVILIVAFRIQINKLLCMIFKWHFIKINLSQHRSIGYLFYLVVSFYGGLIGVGVGAFILFLSKDYLVLDILKAGAVARFLCLFINLTALTIFVFTKKVIYIIGVPMVISGILGTWVGVHIWVKVNKKYLETSVYVLIILEVLVIYLRESGLI